MYRILKFFTLAAIVVCLLFSSSAAPARADCDGAATVTASALNMRSEASTSSTIVTCLPRGTVVLITGSVGDWYQVSYQGNEGYMLSDYLTLTDSADADFGVGTVQGTDVRVRSGPDTSYSILGEENTGATLTITGVSGSWLKVSYNGGEGYVKSTYLSVGSKTSPAGSGSVTAFSGTGTINATDVRLRSGPSTSHEILGVYSTGKTMTVTGDAGDWFRVTCDGVDGYVYKTYLTVGGSGAVSTESSVTAMSDTPGTVISGVHFRSGPGTNYTSQAVLYSGTAVTVTGETDEWYRVTYNGTTGFIYKPYVSTASGAAATPSSEGLRIVEEAKKYLNVPYVYGGASPSGFDCSGFVYYVFQQCGYSVTRSAVTQNDVGTRVSRSELQPGDIVIFYSSTGTSIGHSGIYIGNGQFIHSSSGTGYVVITNLSATYYDEHYYSARRVVG